MFGQIFPKSEKWCEKLNMKTLYYLLSVLVYLSWAKPWNIYSRNGWCNSHCPSFLPNSSFPHAYFWIRKKKKKAFVYLWTQCSSEFAWFRKNVLFICMSALFFVVNAIITLYLFAAIYWCPLKLFSVRPSCSCQATLKVAIHGFLKQYILLLCSA